MEGPFDPESPEHDAGTTPPSGQDGDLHALLERLLGQGDVRPSAPGAGDDLWPDLFPAAAAADEVSTIVPAAEAPSAVAELPAAFDEAPIEQGPIEQSLSADADVPTARPWQPVVVDSGSSTNVDDIHAAILASVSVDLQPIAAAEPAVEPAAAPAVDAPAAPAVDPVEPVVVDAAPVETVAIDEPPPLPAYYEPAAYAASAYDAAAVYEAPVYEPPVDEPPVVETPGAEALPVDTLALETPIVDDAPAFDLTPFDAASVPDAEPEMPPDVEALWAAAVPELGLDIAPQLDLDGIDDAADPIDDLPLAPVTAVVLPWPTQEPKAVDAPAGPRDLIEAALSGLHADLTSEPVEPLRTPDVAAATAHVVFRLGARTMAIPLSAVSEIARPPKVTRLPHVPAWVLGIANLRGDIVSMLDLEGFFSGKAGKSSHEQRMLALRPAGDEVRTAVLVDSVDGIQAFEDARVGRVTRGYDAEVAPYARGLYQMGGDLVVVVDADRLLQSKPMRQFEDGAGAR
jgi:chemotaxis signal transduction protein